MILTKHIKKRFFLTAILLLAGFLVSSKALAAGMSVGNSTLNLVNGENIYYGVTSATNANGNFLLFEKGAGNTVFKIDYAGNITTTGTLNGANSYWTGSGNNLFAATTYNVGIGTADAGAYKLNVNGNTNITGTLNVTGSLTSGGITGLTIAAPNVSSGAFAANTGGGNFSFPANVGVGIVTPVTNGGAASAMIHLNSAANTWSVFHSTNSSTGAAAGDGTIFGTIGNDAYIYNYEAGSLNFNTNGATGNMVLNSSGSLGIGISPEFKLDVNGDIAFPRTSKLMFAGPTVGDRSRSYFTGDGNNNVYLYGPSSNIIATFGYTGGVGIGTTNPVARLQSTGAAQIESPTLGSPNGAGLLVTNSDPLYGLLMGVGASGNAWIQAQRVAGATAYSLNLQPSGGNVGIGTTNPGAYTLFVNGNTNINGTLTATGITGVTVNAANVSAGAFAANTGGGNFSFPGNLTISGGDNAAGTGVLDIVTSGGTNLKFGGNTTYSWIQSHASKPLYINQLGNNIILNSGGGNVGIGTTDPGAYRLYVNGNTNINGTLNATTYTGGSMTGTVSAANVSAGTFAANTGGGNFTFSGNLAVPHIGSTAVASDTNLARIPADSEVALSTSNGGGVQSAWIWRENYAASNWGMFHDNSADTFHIVGNNISRLSVNLASGAVNIGSTLTASGGANIVGNLVMSGTANITGINKISVNTVDPLYNIHGTNYASFAASVVGGVKEEVTGKVSIEDKVGSEYQTVINFDKQTIGSDLWVWHNVVDFNKDNVEALITPYGGFANTYYYISGNSIVFKSDRPTEISYRLIAKRFDWKQWPTLPADQTEKAGLIIK